jgi:hypothetical protein
MREVTATEHQLRAEVRSLDARLGESIRVEEGLRADVVRLRDAVADALAALLMTKGLLDGSGDFNDVVQRSIEKCRAVCPRST